MLDALTLRLIFEGRIALVSGNLSVKLAGVRMKDDGRIVMPERKINLRMTVFFFIIKTWVPAYKVRAV